MLLRGGGYVSRESVELCQWGVLEYNLVLSTDEGQRLKRSA